MKSPCATRLVILARYLTSKIVHWAESELEGRFGLTINRQKTKVIDLMQPHTEVNFLGYAFRWAKVRRNPNRRYCQHHAANKAVKKAKVKIREITNPQQGYKPIEGIVKQLNLYLQGWGQYFCKGVPSEAFAEINWYMDRRMRNFLERRSQRGYKQSQGDGGWYAHLRKLGLRVLSKTRFM